MTGIVKNTWGLTLDSEPNGTVSVVSPVGQTVYETGSQVKVKAEAQANYVFAGWEAQGVTLSAAQIMAEELTFTMPNKEVKLTARIIYDSVDSVTIAGASSIVAGEKAVLAATVMPADYPDKTVTWSIESGGEFLSLQEKADGTAEITGIKAGEAVVKAASNANGAVSGTFAVTVTAAPAKGEGNTPDGNTGDAGNNGGSGQTGNHAKPTAGKGAVQTGDQTTWPVGAMAGAALVIGLVLRRKRRL